MISFKQPKSLKDHLVRAKIAKEQKEPNISKACNGRSDCRVCELVEVSDKFSNMNKTRTYEIRKGTLHCNSDHVVYLMTCQTCEKQYVGSTTTAFRERLNNYKSQFRGYYKAKKKGSQIEINKKNIRQGKLFEHFISHGVKGFDSGKKKEEDWSFWTFTFIDSSSNEEGLLQRESFWQYELDVFEPKGLNMRDVPII